MKKLTTKIFLALVVAMLTTWGAVAQQSPHKPPKNSPKSGAIDKTRSDPCAKYGVGFAKIEGSDICVKIGGGVTIDAGGGRR